MNTKRLYWVDGLRGLACVLIFVHHFCVAFFPATHYGENVISHGTRHWDMFLSQSPLGVVINGNFWVCVFCVISGLVIGYKCFLADSLENVSKDMFKRYFRLALPVFFLSLIVYFMMQLNAFDNTQVNQIVQSPWIGACYNEKIALKKVFLSSFVEVWFCGDATFSNAFWMLQYVFAGSYLSYIISIIVRGNGRRVYLLYLGLGLAFALINSYMLTFVLGNLIAYIMVYSKKKQYNWIGIIEILLGMFCGGFPTDLIPTGIYRIIPHEYFFKIHAVGAFLFIIGIYNCSYVVTFLSKRIFLKLGTISYAVYLVHIPLIYSLSTKIFFMCYQKSGRYQMSAMMTMLCSLVILLFVAFGFYRFIEKNCSTITKGIAQWIVQ